MISCFSNLIGVRGLAGYLYPDSGMYINDLEGITISRLEAIADQTDQYEPRLVFDDLFDRSIRLFEHDVKRYLGRNYVAHSEVRNEITSILNKNTALTQGTNYNGWLFDLWQTQNKKLFFDSISIYLSSTTTFSIYIFDATTGEQLDKITFNGTSGLNTYRILKSYPIWKHRSLFICYDDSEVSTFQTERYYLSLGSITASSIAKTSSVIKTSLTGANTGLIVNYRLECSVDNLVCQRTDLLTVPFLYRLGIEFCKEQLNSDRINRFTLMEREQTKELKDSFTEEYDKMMKGIFDDIKIKERDECFECAKPASYEYSLP